MHAPPSPTTPPHEPNDRQTPVKILLCRNYGLDGNSIIHVVNFLHVHKVCIQDEIKQYLKFTCIFTLSYHVKFIENSDTNKNAFKYNAYHPYVKHISDEESLSRNVGGLWFRGCSVQMVGVYIRGVSLTDPPKDRLTPVKT